VLVLIFSYLRYVLTVFVTLHSLLMYSITYLVSLSHTKAPKSKIDIKKYPINSFYLLALDRNSTLRASS
jgi:hypothetical protein